MDTDQYIKTSDDALFHYTTTSIAIEYILYTKEFKLSLLNDTSDPNEYKFKFFNSLGWFSGPDSALDVEQYNEQLTIDTKRYDELLRKANATIDRILRFKCRVMCFCTNNKPTLIIDGSSIEDEYACSKGWNKPRMWSQYGENHYGVCLVLSKERLEKVCAEKESQIKWHKAHRVKYSDRDGANTLDSGRLKKEGVDQYSFNYVMEKYQELFFRKHIDYRDEAEFRVVVFDPDKKLEYLDVSSSIKSVIVGDRTPDVYIPLINQICSDLSIESRRIRWFRGKFHLGLCKST